jgi:hypothetical protein
MELCRSDHHHESEQNTSQMFAAVLLAKPAVNDGLDDV